MLACKHSGYYSYQEDFHAFATLSLDPKELQLTVRRHLDVEWDPTAVDETFAREVLFVGIYDGHVGPSRRTSMD